MDGGNKIPLQSAIYVLHPSAGAQEISMESQKKNLLGNFWIHIFKNYNVYVHEVTDCTIKMMWSLKNEWYHIGFLGAVSHNFLYWLISTVFNFAAWTLIQN